MTATRTIDRLIGRILMVGGLVSIALMLAESSSTFGTSESLRSR